jgi:hypothetical protein
MMLQCGAGTVLAAAVEACKRADPASPDAVPASAISFDLSRQK